MDTFESSEIEPLVRFLAEPIREVARAFDGGISYAELTLASVRKDPYVWATLARFNAHETLATLNPIGWKFTGLPNCGIRIQKDHVTVRVLKRIGQGVPHPGSSKARNEFWSQFTSEPPLPLDLDGRPLPERVNLILDWDSGADQEVKLELVKPIGSWKYTEKPRVEWAVGIVFGTDDDPGFVGAHEPLDIDQRYDDAELQGG